MTCLGIIVPQPRPEAHEEYERWLVEIREACRKFPGYLTTDVIRPARGHDAYTVIIRFETIEQLRGWIESEVRREFPQRIEHALKQGDRYVIKTGLDFWFAQPAAVTPPKRSKVVVPLEQIMGLDEAASSAAAHKEGFGSLSTI